MGRVDTFTIIRKYTKNKVFTSIIISSIEFVNNKNLLSYVCFPIIVKVSCVALKFWFFQVTCIHGSFISKSNHISMSVLNALI